MSDIIKKLNSASKQLQGTTKISADDVFSEEEEISFKHKLQETIQTIAKNTQVKSFLLQTYKAKFFNRGKNFPKLNKKQKLTLAKDIISHTKKSKEIREELNKSPNRFEKELSILNKAVKMLRKMHAGTKCFFRDELEEQYENNKILKNHFNSMILNGLGISELAELFYENAMRIEKKQAPIPPKQIYNLSRSKLGKTLEMSKTRTKEVDLGFAPKLGLNKNTDF